MKKNKTICLVLAFCLGVSVLWYGAIALTKHTRQVKLIDQEGDRAAALSGITFEGFTSDDVVRYNFRIRNGKVKNNFKALEFNSDDGLFQASAYSAYQPDPDGEMTAEKGPDNTWKINTDRMRLMVRVMRDWRPDSDGQAYFDSGLTIQGMPGEYSFESYGEQPTHMGMGMIDPFSWMCFNQVQDTVTAEMNGKFLVALNLPWAGARLYNVDEWNDGQVMDEAQLMEIANEQDLNKRLRKQAEIQVQPSGSAQLMTEWSSTDVTRVLYMQPLGDKLIVLTQTDASRPCYKQDAEGWVVKNDRPAESWVNALVCDENGNVQESVPLMRLSDEYSYPARAVQMNVKENELSFTLEAGDSNASKVHLQKGIVLRMEEGKLKAIGSPTFASSTEGEALGLAETEEHPRAIAAVEADASGERVAVVWQEYAEMDESYTKLNGGDCQIQVFENGKSIYRGTLKCGWENENRYLLTGGWDFNIGEMNLPSTFIGFRKTDANRYYGGCISYPSDQFQTNIFYK